MTNFSEETPGPSPNQNKEKTVKHFLSKNEIIDRLDDAVKQSEEGKSATCNYLPTPPMLERSQPQPCYKISSRRRNEKKKISFTPNSTA